MLWESWDWLRPGFTGDLRGRYQVNTGPFSLSCSGSSWEPWTSAVLVASSFQPASVWRSHRFLSDWRTDFTNRTEHCWAVTASCQRLNQSHGSRIGLWMQLWRHEAWLTLRRGPFRWRWKPLGCACERSLTLFSGVKTIRHLYCPFPGWALTHPVYWKEFNRRQLGPYGPWSHPKSLVMIALFYTGCSLHALSFPRLGKFEICFCRSSLVCYCSLTH